MFSTEIPEEEYIKEIVFTKTSKLPVIRALTKSDSSEFQSLVALKKAANLNELIFEQYGLTCLSAREVARY